MLVLDRAILVKGKTTTKSLHWKLIWLLAVWIKQRYFLVLLVAICIFLSFSLSFTPMLILYVMLKMSAAKVLPGHYVGHRNSRWGPLQGAVTQLRQGRKLGPVLATSLLFWSLSDLWILAQNRIQKGQLEANIIVTIRNVLQLLIHPACVGGTGRSKVGLPRSPFDWKYRKWKVAQTPNFSSGNPRECMFYLINSNVCFQF